MADMIQAASELPWALYSLEMDEPGKKIGRFFKESGFTIIREPINTDFPRYPSNIEKAVTSAVPFEGKVLAVYGSGSLHYFTYGLCRRADSLSQEYGYIHIDHHSDDYFVSTDYGEKINEKAYEIHCGAFVREIVFTTNVRKPENVLWIGGSKGNLYGSSSISESALTVEGLSSLERMLCALPNDVYVTIDLDVMSSSEIITDWGNGNMNTRSLLAILDVIKEKKRIISADICGLSSQKISRGLAGGMKLYTTIASNLLGTNKGAAR